MCFGLKRVSTIMRCELSVLQELKSCEGQREKVVYSSFFSFLPPFGSQLGRMVPEGGSQ